MSTRGVLFLLLGIFFLAGAAAAATDLTHSTMTSSNTGWIVANGEDQATITVHVTDGASDLNGATVEFSLADDSTDLGTLSATTQVTGTDGIARSVFTTKTKSGIATIKARVTYNDGSGIPATVTLSCTQKIDHDKAYSATPDSVFSVPAGSVTHLNITFRDEPGNPVDDKNKASDQVHMVHLWISGDGGSGFASGGGYVQDLYVPTDVYGNVSVDLRVSSKAGPNSIQVYGLDYFGGMPITISSVADDVPCFIVQTHPDPSSYPADGTHKFTLYYTVLDKYQNPLQGVELLVTSSIGEETRIISNENGMNFTDYGPKDVAKVYTISASPVITGTKTSRNATILCMDTGETGTCTQTITYTPLDPVEMILTASPQTMVSWDVAGASKVNVNAKVVDSYGNGVKDQTVTFTKSPDTATGFKETAPSDLSPASAITDANGYAVVQFQPGTFAIKGQPGYNDAATGTCKVTAKWTNPKTGEVKSRDITFIWKNYPFLSVDSAVDNPSPQVGDTVNVKVWIRGTGAALQPKPIDVVLVMDRSGSMLENYPGRSDDAMVEAQAAALKFSDNLDQNKDRIGIVSFGDDDGTNGWARLAPTGSAKYGWNWRDNVYPYWFWVKDDSMYPKSTLECGSSCNGYRRDPNNGNSYGYSDSSYDINSAHHLYLKAHYNNGVAREYGENVYTRQDLSLDYHTKTDVSNALMSIVPAGGTPMREGLSAAISMFPAYSTARPVRAIILLTDGAYTTTNPENNPSVIDDAKNNNIKIFTIGLGNEVQSTSLERYAKNTGGVYYPADDPSKLDGIYTEIAGKLNEQAGGQTQLVADFSTINVDGNQVSEGVDNFITYQYQNGGLVDSSSTFVSKTSTNVPVDTTKNDYYTQVRDDRDNWTSPKIPGLTARKLQFDVGKIILNDVWETNIQFKITGAGLIQLLGESSPVTFIDLTDPNNPKSQTVPAPSVVMNAQLSKSPYSFGSAPTLTITGVTVAETALDPSLWTVTWKTTYDGASTVREKLQYCSKKAGATNSCSQPRSAWAVYPQPIGSMGKVTDRESTLNVDTTSWNPGEEYTLSIWAQTDDGQISWGDNTHKKEDGSNKAYIKLQ